MNFTRLIIVLAAIALLIWGYSHFRKWRLNEEREEYLKYAGVIAETQVAAELHRHEPDSFFIARDSILQKYAVTLDEMNALESLYQGQERRWGELWFYVDSLTDSLVDHYDSLFRDAADDTTKAVDPE